MSSKQYIHLDSTYRNRNVYPLPAEYVVPITSNNTVGLPSAITADDPVSNAYPQYTLVGQTANRGPEAFNGGTYATPVLNIAASTVDSYYNGYNITDNTLGQTRQIIGYVGATQTVTLDHPFSNTWAVGDNYTIADPSTNAIIHMQPAAPLVPGYYNGLVLKDETSNEYRYITAYSGNTRLATVSSPFTVWAVTDSYSVRAQRSNEQALVAAATALTVTLPITASTDPDVYVGQFLYMQNGPAAGQARIIASYNGLTRTATVTPPFNPVPVAGNTYEILPFSYDNSTSLAYSGSVLSQMDTTNYEVSLVSLDIPNLDLVTAPGYRPSFYPYLLVEITNETSTGGHGRNILYSNNPHAIRTTFVVPVSDVNNPLSTQFLSLTANGVTQTMRFKPNDNLRFSLRTPAGELFNVGPDTVSPAAPNPRIQISAVFGIKRI
jgi:hypothetical protein